MILYKCNGRYLTYGEACMEQITLSMSGEWSSIMVTILVCITAYTKFSLTLHPLAEGIFEVGFMVIGYEM